MEFQTAECYQEFCAAMVQFLEGRLDEHPTHQGPLYPDCRGDFAKRLIDMNKLGFLTHDSQPGSVKGDPGYNYSTDRYSRGYVEGFVPTIWIPYIIQHMTQELVFETPSTIHFTPTINSPNNRDYLTCVRLNPVMAYRVQPIPWTDSYVESKQTDLKKIPPCNANLIIYRFEHPNKIFKNRKLWEWSYRNLTPVTFWSKNVGAQGIENIIVDGLTRMLTPTTVQIIPA